MEAAVSSTLKSKPRSPFQTVIWSATIGVLLVATLVTVRPYLLILHASPTALWVTLNLIVFAIWKLSTNSVNNQETANHDNATDPSSPPSFTSPHHASKLIRKPNTPHETNKPRNIVSNTVPEEVAVVEEDESMEDTWKAIMERRRHGGGSTPATVIDGNSKQVIKKSDTWERWRLPCPERVVARLTEQKELRKLATDTYGEKSYEYGESSEASKGVEHVGWRRREVLMVDPDELLRRRADAFIQKFRLQRQESEHRHLLEQSKQKSNSSAG